MWPGAPLTKALVIPFSVYLCGLGNICKLVSFVFVLKWWNMKKFSVKINNENMLCVPAVPLMGKFLCLASLSL